MEKIFQFPSVVVPLVYKVFSEFGIDLTINDKIILYHECTKSAADLTSPFTVFLEKELSKHFGFVYYLEGGYSAFEAAYPDLCSRQSTSPSPERGLQPPESSCLERLLERCLCNLQPLPPLMPAFCLGPASISSSEVSSAGAQQAPKRILDSGSLFGPHCKKLRKPQSLTLKRSESLRPRPAGCQPESADTSSGAQAIGRGGPHRLHCTPASLCMSAPVLSEAGEASVASASPPPPATPLLPHLVLGCQADAMSAETCARHHITHVINISVDGPASPHVPAENLLRVSIMDNFTANIGAHFERAFSILDEAKRLGGCVLVHCSAGISRSPTLTIAYLMRTCHMTLEEAYRFVKDQRPRVSPNFNFLGQLVIFEKQISVGSSLSHDKPSSQAYFPVLIQHSPGNHKPVVGRARRLPDSRSLLRGLETRMLPEAPQMVRDTLIAKRRERPSNLALDSDGAAPTFRLPSCADLEPTELRSRKRSRNHLSPEKPAVAGLLPSPSAGIAQLALSSPIDEYARGPLIQTKVARQAEDAGSHRLHLKPFSEAAAAAAGSTDASSALNLLLSDHHTSRADSSEAPGPRRRDQACNSSWESIFVEQPSSSQASSPIPPRKPFILHFEDLPCRGQGSRQPSSNSSRSSSSNSRPSTYTVS